MLKKVFAFLVSKPYTKSLGAGLAQQSYLIEVTVVLKDYGLI